MTDTVTEKQLRAVLNKNAAIAVDLTGQLEERDSCIDGLRKALNRQGRVLAEVRDHLAAALARAGQLEAERDEWRRKYEHVEAAIDAHVRRALTPPTSTGGKP